MKKIIIINKIKIKITVEITETRFFWKSKLNHLLLLHNPLRKCLIILVSIMIVIKTVQLKSSVNAKKTVSNLSFSNLPILPRTTLSFHLDCMSLIRISWVLHLPWKRSQHIKLKKLKISLHIKIKLKWIIKYYQFKIHVHRAFKIY